MDLRIKKFRYCVSYVNTFFRKVYRKLFNKQLRFRTINGRKVIYDFSSVNRLISAMISSGKPFMAARYGANEIWVMDEFYRTQMGFMKDYQDKLKQQFEECAGFFPADSEHMDRFAGLMIEDSGELDIIGMWNDRQERFFVENYGSRAAGVELSCLEPYYDLSTSWTHALAGKTILVVHPFEETIRSQWEIKEKLFGETFWPEDCRLVTIKAVQTVAGERDARFSDWFEALDYMKKRIDETEFDLAVIGCGAYGFPLAAHVKRKGKQAIHLGGATQVLFGIKARRWDESPISRLYNDSWVYPGDNDKIKNPEKVEGSCYW